MKMKAYLISRVSTEDQLEALPAQTIRLVSYAEKLKFNYELFSIVESAYKEKRDEFQKVIDRIKSEPEIVHVVFDKIDRYSRDSSSSYIRELNKLRRMGRVELHFVSDGLIISKDSPAPDEFRLGIGVLTAQYYSDATRDNVKRRREQMLNDGLWPHPAPVGYKNTVDSQGNKWIELDPILSIAVKEAFEMYGSGIYSLKAIAKKWRDEYGLKAGPSRVEHALNNPFYYGLMRSNEKLYQHNYERIIDQEAFNKIDEVKKGFIPTKRRWAGKPYPYRGLITCSTCGNLITFETKKGKYTYGHCTQSTVKHPHTSIKEEELTEIFSNNFSDFTMPEVIYDQIKKEIESSAVLAGQLTAIKIKRYKSELSKLETQREKLYQDYLDNRISIDFHDKLHNNITTKIQNIKNALTALEHKAPKQNTSYQSLLNLAKEANQLFKEATYLEKRELIKLTHSNLIFDDDGLRWELKSPFDLIGMANKTQNWCPGMDSNHRP